MSPSAWFDLADLGAPGYAAIARLVLVVATGWVVVRPERVIDPTTQLGAFGVPALAVVMIGLSRTTGDYAFIGVFAGIGHALSVAVWFGGLALVARVVLAGPGEEDLVHAVRAYSRISVPAMLVVAITGVIQVFRLVGTDIFTSTHGRVMLLKTLLVVAMLFVALTVRQMVAARLDRASEMTIPLANRFRRAFTAEAAIGVVVMASSAWLLALEPGKVEPFERADYIVVQPFVDAPTGFDITVSIGPSQVGLNALLVEIEKPQDGISNVLVEFLPPEGVTGAIGIQQPIPLVTAGTAYREVVNGIPFNVPGVWTMRVSGQTATGIFSPATAQFTVTAADGTVIDTTGSTTTTVAPGASPQVTVIVDPADTATTTTAAAG